MPSATALSGFFASASDFTHSRFGGGFTEGAPDVGGSVGDLSLSAERLADAPLPLEAAESLALFGAAFEAGSEAAEETFAGAEATVGGDGLDSRAGAGFPAAGAGFLAAGAAFLTAGAMPKSSTNTSQALGLGFG
ncbi:hypothetical protein [Botrimarina hoheduenensis]|uniref:hypothetical protein n=1 Tax=Botrimarina hoheduenensis TaxID=2528000 RepID=UPI0011B754B0|nr:hypothetical protein [Botrimarina hoheduenensis]